MSEKDKIEYRALKLFVETISQDSLIKFMMGQQDAIDGLTKNNRSFREAYIKMLDEKKSLLTAKEKETEEKMAKEFKELNSKYWGAGFSKVLNDKCDEYIPDNLPYNTLAIVKKATENIVE